MNRTTEQLFKKFEQLSLWRRQLVQKLHRFKTRVDVQLHVSFLSTISTWSLRLDIVSILCSLHDSGNGRQIDGHGYRFWFRDVSGDRLHPPHGNHTQGRMLRSVCSTSIRLSSNCCRTSAPSLKTRGAPSMLASMLFKLTITGKSVVASSKMSREGKSERNTANERLPNFRHTCVLNLGTGIPNDLCGNSSGFT